jgi:hypothetical protein
VEKVGTAPRTRGRLAICDWISWSVRCEAAQAQTIGSVANGAIRPLWAGAFPKSSDNEPQWQIALSRVTNRSLPEEDVLVLGDDGRISKRALNDGAESFEITTIEAADPSRIVLFAVGAGGDPRRHRPLLTSLADHGCTVVAPHFERLVSPIPAESDLLLRARRLRLALDSVMQPGLPVAGVGHSIGTAMLLGLAGGQIWTITRRHLSIDPDLRLDRLALMTPVTAFFRAPGALDAVRVPILAWAGTRDEITPPAQATFLKDSLAGRASVEVRIADGAGHFSFMNEPPPGTTEPLPNRDIFLADLAAEICRFVTT